MIILTSIFLLVAMSAYTVFGGADFGGGILEASLVGHQKLQKRLQATLAPVWEANHVWLIAVVVIMFVGFPIFYAQALTRLYIPVYLALLAIMLRGVFFTFRKYDPAPEAWQWGYSFLFRFSSFMAPVFFGFIVSGLMSEHCGSPTKLPEQVEFVAIYITPWFNGFGAICGLFIAFLFATLASVFFYGELLEDEVENREILAKRIKIFFGLTFATGGLVLCVGGLSGRVPWSAALNPFQVLLQTLAGIGTIFLFRALKHGKTWWLRMLVGLQTLCILGGWTTVQWPNLIKTANGNLTVFDAAAPLVTLKLLVIGMVVVLALVLPALVMLYKVFHRSSEPQH